MPPQTTTQQGLLANAPIHAVVSVTDINRARDFYTNKLGLTVEKESPEQGLMFAGGDGTRLYCYPRQEAPKAENTVVSFGVTNVEDTVQNLRNNGVRFEEYDLPGLKTVNGVADMGGMKGAWFKDPDGNILAVSEFSI